MPHLRSMLKACPRSGCAKPPTVVSADAPTWASSERASSSDCKREQLLQSKLSPPLPPESRPRIKGR
eukprot:364739-Chlamydomonas_euryale.AAC.3